MKDLTGLFKDEVVRCAAGAWVDRREEGKGAGKRAGVKKVVVKKEEPADDEFDPSDSDEADDWCLK